jgi:hypothetical protein
MQATRCGFIQKHAGSTLWLYTKTCRLHAVLRNAITRWFKYDRDKLWLVYTQIVPVIFEPPCILYIILAAYCVRNQCWRTSDHFCSGFKKMADACACINSHGIK